MSIVAAKEVGDRVWFWTRKSQKDKGQLNGENVILGFFR